MGDMGFGLCLPYLFVYGGKGNGRGRITVL